MSLSFNPLSNTLFGNSAELEQARRPVEPGCGGDRVFDSLSREQQTVAKVVGNVFDSLHLEWWWKRPSPEDGNSARNPALNNIPLLPEPMDTSLDDLNPELKEILNEWVNQGEPQKKQTKVVARSRITDFLESDRKKELDLSLLNLKSLPALFHKEPFTFRLTSLNLSSNKLTEFPKEICQLQKLEVLHLSNNQLTELPREICQLTNLTTLDLSDNRLTELPEEIYKLTNLEILNLSYNQLTWIPQEINQLKKLSLLDLKNNSRTFW